MSDAAKPLDYASPAIPVRRWVKRIALLAWLAFTIYLAYEKWGLWVKLQARVVQAERQCARFVAPADSTAFEGDPERAAALRLAGGYREVDAELFHNSGAPIPTPPMAALAVADAWEQFQGALMNMKWWDERDTPPFPYTSAFGGGLFGGDKGLGPTDQFAVFLHERRAPGGDARLVLVDAYLYGNGSMRFDATVVSKGGLMGRPEFLKEAEGPSSDSDVAALRPAAHESIRLWAARPDPSDASRFTIPYEVGDSRGVVEGRLTPDDRVVFEVIAGSSESPAR